MDWEEIRNEYVTTKTSYRKLAEKYGLSFDVLRKKGEREKWTELRRKSVAKVSQKTVEKIIERESDRLAKNTELAVDIQNILLVRLKKELQTAKLSDMTKCTAMTRMLSDLKAYTPQDKGQNETDSSDEVITLLDKIANEQ